jgi:hypothetical protein
MTLYCIVTWIVIWKNSEYVFKSVENMAFSLNLDKCAFMVVRQLLYLYFWFYKVTMLESINPNGER